VNKSLKKKGARRRAPRPIPRRRRAPVRRRRRRRWIAPRRRAPVRRRRRRRWIAPRRRAPPRRRRRMNRAVRSKNARRRSRRRWKLLLQTGEGREGGGVARTKHALKDALRLRAMHRLQDRLQKTGKEEVQRAASADAGVTDSLASSNQLNLESSLMDKGARRRAPRRRRAARRRRAKMNKSLKGKGARRRAPRRRRKMNKSLKGKGRRRRRKSAAKKSNNENGCCKIPRRGAIHMGKRQERLVLRKSVSCGFSRCHEIIARGRITRYYHSRLLAHGG